MTAYWDDERGYFWMGANGAEFIAHKGSHHIFIYPTDEHPSPPSNLIQHGKRIETEEDFREALEEGETYRAFYVKDKAI